MKQGLRFEFELPCIQDLSELWWQKLKYVFDTAFISNFWTSDVKCLEEIINFIKKFQKFES